MYLAHHGIKGQKWGERKYQYKDGSLTPEGRRRYGVLGSTKAYIQRRRKNVTKFYKESKNLGDDKTPEQMTKKERAIYDKAESSYKRRQANAGKQYRADLKRGFNDKKRAIGLRKAKAKDALADKGEYGVWGHVFRSASWQYAGSVAGRAVGKALISKALKNNPNLKVNSKELLDIASKTGRNVGRGIAYAESIAAYSAKKSRDSEKKSRGSRSYRFVDDYK